MSSAAVILTVATQCGTSGVDNASDYAFLTTFAGHPVTQNSCKPLPVAVYPAGGPADAADLVSEAVGILRSATGLDIKVVGVFGGHAPRWNFTAAPLLPDDPIGVSWQDDATIAKLTNEVAGLGGSIIGTSPAGTEYLVSGTIALSRDYFARSGHAHQLAVILHEFGHVLGLDHVMSRNEVMFPVVGATELGPGDLAGLKLAGKGPCI